MQHSQGVVVGDASQSVTRYLKTKYDCKANGFGAITLRHTHVIKSRNQNVSKCKVVFMAVSFHPDSILVKPKL